MAAGEIGRLSTDAQTSLLRYCVTVLDLHKRMESLQTKMTLIDIAYARYKDCNSNTGNGEDTQADACGAETCGVTIPEITVPIVVSQVDSYVAYLAEVFLSGYPLFPVVASPANQNDANMLQAIIDDHSTRGRYARQLLMNFKDAAKYNFTVAEVDWCPIDTYSVASSYDQITKQKPKMSLDSFSINKVTRKDPYNVLFDYRVHPVDVPYIGEYSGYIEIISRIELKRRLQYYATSGYGYNTTQAMTSKLGTPTGSSGGLFDFLGYYKEPPQISNLITKGNLRNAGLQDWVAWFGANKNKQETIQNYSDVYEFVTLYARIIPDEHGIDGPRKGSPQVWKLRFVNHTKLVYAERIFSVYDMLPMMFSQPFEDGFDLQTESIAERGMPFQEVSSTLLAIRLNAARRAIMDRAIYDPSLIRESDVNTPVAAPKIPLKANSQMGGKKLEDAYKSIPFDSRGTETVLQDMNNLGKMADNLNGINQPQQGQFQKGNKTRKEWDDTMANAGSRSRLAAFSMEMQFFLPMKEQLKLNIYQYQGPSSFQNAKTGAMYDIKAEDLTRIKQKISLFKIADGYTPAEKLASTDVLTQGMQLLSQSPILQSSLGVMLPKMFIHLMSLGGVQGLEEYMPTEPATGGAPQQQTTATPVQAGVNAQQPATAQTQPVQNA